MNEGEVIKPAFQLGEEETKILEGCLEGERRSQLALYNRYKDAMYTLALRITSDKEVAEDVLQEAFIGVFRGIAKFKKQSTLGAWIKTILVRSAYRRLKKEPVTQEIGEMQTENMISWPSEIDAKELEQAIHDLPEGYRSVFVLVEVEGFKHKEVADMLGISAGTSKSQLFHAKKQLRKKLKHYVTV